MENLVTLTYGSTHYYLIDVKNGKLLVDAGMAGTLPKFQNQLKQAGVNFTEIKYVMMTHHHPDHAGILQEIKNRSGAKLLIHTVQIPYLTDLRSFYEKKGGYVPIRVEKDDLVLQSPNRDILHRLGILGEVVETPGHSPDSVSLVLDSGMAFIGDLNPYYSGEAQNEALNLSSWKQLLERRVKIFYPAHANPFTPAELKPLLGSL